MGRPRKPTALKLLDGDRPDRIHGDEPTAPPGLGDVPTWLDRHGRDAWERLDAVHRETRLLTRLDAELVTLYCQSYSTFRHALETITRDLAAAPEESFARPHPYMKVVNEAHRQMGRILSKLGMSPSDRAGLHVEGKPEDDELLAFLAKPKASDAKPRRSSRP